MIGKLKGIIEEISEDSIILDVSGVGYQVYCPLSLMNSLKAGIPSTFYIHMLVREDNITLFGFANASEKYWFNLLQTVQGVGARMALAILGAFNIERIQTAIAAADQGAFKSISGIGPKLAARIVNELKNKKEIFSGVPEKTGLNNTPLENNIINDAISALTNLGFNRSDAFLTVSKLKEANDNIDLASLLKLALAKLTS